ncbi:chloride channel protein [Namhaeicola litoreus]|uniref:Chloride channel protein n=1 Tax=Namhaeicola litoreus TaxID=1052145 RepID=A0ABW3Y120_9FLAO
MDFKVALTKFLRWRYKYFTQSQFRNIASAIIGLLAGLGAVTLKNLTHFIQVLLEGKFVFEFHKAFYFVFPIIGLLLVFLVKKYVIRKPVGHGIPSTLYAISKLKSILPRHQMWSSLITAPITVGFGGSVGLEGPTVATGAALGSNFGNTFHLNQATRTLLIGAAAAGAMSSIFKAPIAAILFAVEIFSLDLTLASIIPLILASITAILTSYFFSGNDVLFHFQLQDKFRLIDVGFFLLLGGITALTSIYFSKVYFFVGDFFKKLGHPFKRLLVGGVALGVIVYFVPPLFGEGYEVINNLLKDNYSGVLKYNFFNIPTDNSVMILMMLSGLVLLKVFATSITFGAGGVGGVFAPTLFTGSITGYVFAKFVNYLNIFEHQLSNSNFALVGMAGLMAGVLHAPLTAIFLIAEITGGYELFVPLMIVALISFIITKKYVPFNIYATHLAERGELITHDKDKAVLALMEFDKLIEQNFISLSPNMKFGDMLKNCVVNSNRNIFPVVDDENNFIGIVLLDNIRSSMFNEELYETTTVDDFMQAAPEVINYEADNMNEVMKKFQDSGAWNLPVLKDGKYEGFISKSKLLTAYRRKLIMVTS